MPLSVTDLVKSLFRRPATKPTPTRVKLSLTSLEDRTVPTPVVTIQALSDAVEGGATGSFRLTRSDTNGQLAVGVAIGGTAIDVDYTLSGVIGNTVLGGPTYYYVEFANGVATADVTVSASTDAIYDPDETVTLAVTSGTGYTVGGSGATVNITDDSSTVETLIHQETFQLTGSSGPVNVTLTVTLNASGAAGLYTWSYAVTNPSSNTSSLTGFVVPIDGMDTDVGGLTSSIGWTGTVGTGSVSWAAGTGLTPGSTATFAFTTDPREVGEATLTANGGGGFFADLPVAPASRPVTVTNRPMIRATFYAGINDYKLTLNFTDANGTSYTTGATNFSNVATKTAARDLLYAYLLNNGWAVEKAGDFDLLILGRIESDKSITAIKTATYRFTNVSTGVDYATVPAITNVGQVTVSEANP